MKEYTMKEVQEICDRLGVTQLRMMYTPRVQTLSGEEPPRYSAMVTQQSKRTVGAQGATMDEAFERAVDIVSRRVAS